MSTGQQQRILLVLFTPLTSRYPGTNWPTLYLIKNTVWDVKFRFLLWDYQKGSLCWWFIRIKVQTQGRGSNIYVIRDWRLETGDWRPTQRLIIDFISSSQQTVSRFVRQWVSSVSVWVVLAGAGCCCLVCQCQCQVQRVVTCNYSQLKVHNA